MNVTDKTGVIVGAEMVDDDDKLILMTTTGKAIRMKVKDIRTTGRVAQGVKLINLAPNDLVNSLARVVQEADEGELEAVLASDEEIVVAEELGTVAPESPTQLEPFDDPETSDDETLEDE